MPNPTNNSLGGESPLLVWLDSFTGNWVRHWSLVAWAPLRPTGANSVQKQQRNRDIFILSMLFVSTIAFIVSIDLNRSNYILQMFATLGIYRAFDLSITVIRTGVFLNFRGDVALKEEPSWRVRRVLVGVLVNYLELIMWFAVIYYYLALVCGNQFNFSISEAHQALYLSMSTMTTVGYGGYAPNTLISTSVTLWQSLLAILMVASVIGNIIAVLSNPSSARTVPFIPNERNWKSWVVPILIGTPMLAFIYIFLNNAKDCS